MFSKKLKALSLALAAAVTFSAMPAAAVINYDDPDSQIDVRINKPYLNFTVEGGDGVDVSDMNFSIKDSENHTVATFRGGDDKLTRTWLDTLDFSQVHSVEDLSRIHGDTSVGLLYDQFIPDPDKGAAPMGSIYTRRGTAIVPAQTGGGVYLRLTDEYYYYYIDENKFSITETRTVPAGTIVVDVNSKFAALNNTTTRFNLAPDSSDAASSDFLCNNKYYFRDHVGMIEEYPTAAGKYKVYINGGRAGGYTCESYDHPTTYHKIKMKFSDAFPGLADDNLIIEEKFSDTYYSFDLRGDNSTNVFSNIIYSGAMITVPVPDADGNIEVWLKSDDLKAMMQYSFSCPGGHGGGSVVNVQLPHSTEKINFLFEYPQTGFCLYGLSPDDYTLYVDGDDSDRYFIEDPTVTTSSQKTMRRAAFTVQKRLLLGDCDRDDDIDVNDLTSLAAHIKGVATLSGRAPIAGDIDENNKLDFQDMVGLAEHIKGISRLPHKYV